MSIPANVDKYNTVREPTMPSSVTEKPPVSSPKGSKSSRLKTNAFRNLMTSSRQLSAHLPRWSQALVEHLEPDSVDRDVVIQSHIQKLGSSPKGYGYRQVVI
ncbi:hypothetical protein V8E54_011001 [Elaphomyces granulatus]